MEYAMNFLYIACAVIGFLLGINIYKAIMHIIRMNKNKQKFANVVKIKKGTLCEGPHEWFRTTLAFMKLPISDYNVCSKCGFVSNTEFQLNAAGIETVQQAIVIQNDKERVKNYLKIRLEDELKIARDKWIDQNLYELSISDEGARRVYLEHLFKYAIEKSQSIQNDIKGELRNGTDGPT